MAESLLLPVVHSVVGKAADALVQSVTRMWGVEEERRRLDCHLVYVQSLLADAEAKSKTNHAVRTWMKELKAAAEGPKRRPEGVNGSQIKISRPETIWSSPKCTPKSSSPR